MKFWKRIETMPKLKSKEWFALMVITLFVVDIIILLDIPFLRPAFAFLYFTIIPGLLILYIFKSNRIGFLKKFVLYIGLSIAFLMFVGLFINAVYPFIGFSKPLSTSSLVVSFTVILSILSFIAYKRNKEDFDINDVFNFKRDLRDKLTAPLIFPIIFPCLAVLGTYLMNTQGNNTILMVMLFLIPIYVTLVVFLNKKIPKTTYPVAILMISIALLLKHGLTSNYLNGADVHSEYYAFQLVVSNLYWSMSNYPDVLTATLSTSLLPTIYQSLLGISGLHVYKLVYQLIFSVTPLVVYLISKRYIKEMYAFLASFLFMAQLPFMGDMQSAVRGEIALLFFALAIMVLLDDEIDELLKKILLILFIIGTIVSHYTTAYIFFLILFLCWLIFNLINNFSKFKSPNSKRKITISEILIFFIIVFFWYSQITDTAFNTGITFIENTIRSQVYLFVDDARAPGIMHAVGRNIETIPHKIRIISYEIIFAFIAIGALSLIKKNIKDPDEYTLMVLISVGLVPLWLIMPYISTYGILRLYPQLLVLLAPAFFMGVDAVFKSIRKQRCILSIVLLILIIQFSSSALLIDQLFGIPASMDLNREGSQHDDFYIYDREVIAAKWLKSNNIDDLMVFTDPFGTTRLKQVEGIKSRSSFYRRNETVDNCYIYLRHANVCGRVFTATKTKAGFTSQLGYTPITTFSHLFIEKNKIYNNKGATIYE